MFLTHENKFSRRNRVITPTGAMAASCSLPFKHPTMAFQKTYHRSDGSRVKIEPVCKIEAFDNDAFEWSYIVYHSALGQGKFEDMTTELL